MTQEEYNQDYSNRLIEVRKHNCNVYKGVSAGANSTWSIVIDGKKSGYCFNSRWSALEYVESKIKNPIA